MDCEINKDLTISLPNEIFEEILSYIEFDHLQKVCIFVCKRWFNFIRNSARLSNCVFFSLEEHDYVNIPKLNKLLKNWPQVKNLGLRWNDFIIPFTEVFDEHSQESLNSKRIRFSMTTDLFSFLWPSLSSMPLYSYEFLYYEISTVEAKSSLLITKSISEVTGNKLLVNVYFTGSKVLEIAKI